jgi:glycosyltransferase involved in cell wall biosynthesis
MIRVLFLIRSLNRGGAERQLTQLVKGIDRTRFAVTVVTLYDGGAHQTEIESLEGITVFSLHKKGRWDILLPIWRLLRILRDAKPHIVHGYMDVANALALLLGKLAAARVVWGLRASDVDFSQYDRISALSFRLAGWLSPLTDLIIINSHAGKRHYGAQGFCDKRMIVIPNGYDTIYFQPDAEAGRRIRRAWGIEDSELLIGLVARLDPIKDHRTFLQAAALLSASRPDTRFVCVGDGQADYRQELQDFAEKLGIGNRVIWAGELTDMREVHNALDVATSSSSSEGFSNTIGEAMACGIPCVVTCTGDSATLVGNTGVVVPLKDPAQMCAAWMRLLDMPAQDRAALGRCARERIMSEYSIQQLVCRSEAALTGLIATTWETPVSGID